MVLLVGTLMGIIIGVLPGLGPSFGVALMIPLTFGMEPAAAIIFLTAIHASTVYGGSISTILINTPGSPGNVATAWDGYPMAEQGKAGKALGISTASSLFGGIIGWVSLVLVSPFLVSIALKMGPVEMFMLGLAALSLLSVASQGNTIKGLIFGAFGLLISFIGRDPFLGAFRFTLGLGYLEDGIPLVPVLIGLFALPQVFILSQKRGSIAEVLTPGDSVLSGVLEVIKRPISILRSGIIGIILGIMPALGISTANVVAYLLEKRSSKMPENFGKGAPEGVLAPEVANNACVIGDLVPTFTLGIPGSATTAILMAALVMHGLNPGPTFFQKGIVPYAVFVGILLAQGAFAFFGLLFACPKAISSQTVI
jgi:putative tricarboxylic transport membrane protein